MANLERICANCGNVNPIDRARCARCGSALVQASEDKPARNGARSLIRPEAVDARALAVGAGVVLARAGWTLFRRFVLPRAWRVVNEVAESARNRALVEHQPKAAETRRAPGEDGDAVIRSWRVWSVRRGRTEYSGSESTEWRIKRK